MFRIFCSHHIKRISRETGMGIQCQAGALTEADVPRELRTGFVLTFGFHPDAVGERCMWGTGTFQCGS